MKHSGKVKMARKMRTQLELVAGVSIFDTDGWNKRKKAIAERVKRREERSRLYIAKWWPKQ